MNVLVLNSGSSSLKFQLIATDLETIKADKDQRLCRGLIEGIGHDAKVTVSIGDKPKNTFSKPLADLPAALEFLINWIASKESGIEEVQSLADIHAVGQRVVHGGERFTESAVISDEVLKGIQDCVELAPLHNPDNIKCIQAARRLLGAKVPQVAVFDTAFHHRLPKHAFLYAIPYELYQEHHIRRYGFHGTSHRYVSYRYRFIHHLTREQTNIITLHLGNGCSAAAIHAGYPVDTSMGLTPLEGLVMGTRSGDLDPAIVGLIAEKKALKTGEVESLLNTKSGLLGISGSTNDMRTLQKDAAEKKDARAELAIEMFCYRAKKYIGAYLGAMNGTDAIVFTGGIGENSAEVRAKICEGLDWFGLKLDEERNKAAIGKEMKITTDDSRLHAFVIPTDEELLIARDTVRCILGVPHPS
jgi:acetate kinase